MRNSKRALSSNPRVFTGRANSCILSPHSSFSHSFTIVLISISISSSGTKSPESKHSYRYRTQPTNPHSTASPICLSSAVSPSVSPETRTPDHHFPAPKQQPQNFNAPSTKTLSSTAASLQKPTHHSHQSKSLTLPSCSLNRSIQLFSRPRSRILARD